MSEKEDQIRAAEHMAGQITDRFPARVRPDKRVHRTGDLRRDVMEGATHVSYLISIIEALENA